MSSRHRPERAAPRQCETRASAATAARPWRRPLRQIAWNLSATTSSALSGLRRHKFLAENAFTPQGRHTLRSRPRPGRRAARRCRCPSAAIRQHVRGVLQPAAQMQADPLSGRGASEALRGACVPSDMVDVDGDAEVRGRRGLARRRCLAHGEEAGLVAAECWIERPRGPPGSFCGGADSRLFARPRDACAGRRSLTASCWETGPTNGPAALSRRS